MVKEINFFRSRFYWTTCFKQEEEFLIEQFGDDFMNICPELEDGYKDIMRAEVVSLTMHNYI